MKKELYELDKILKLVDQRNLLTTQLKTIETPKLIIKAENGNPLYKFCMSPVGDFMIFINRKERSSLFGMLSKIENPEDFLSGKEPEVTISYLEAFRALSSKKRSNSERRDPNSGINRLRPGIRPELLPNSMEEEYEWEESDSSDQNWKLILALPAHKCIPLIELLYTIFRDDLYQYKEEHPN